MLDLKLIRDNPEILKEALIARRQPADQVDALLARIQMLDAERRQTITTLQEAQARRNQISKEVGKAKAAKREAQAQTLMAEIGDLKDAIAEGEGREKEVSAELDELLAGIPNIRPQTCRSAMRAPIKKSAAPASRRNSIMSQNSISSWARRSA